MPAIKLQPYIDKFNKLDVKIRYGAFAGALLLFVLLDYFLILGPQLGFLGKIGDDIKATSSNIQRVRADMQRINDIKQGLEGSRAQLEALDTKIRLLPEVPALLQEISDTANAAHVVIDQLLPSKEGPKNLLATGDVKYYDLPIVVEAHSGYHMFGHFLNQLENGKLLFMVKDLRIEGNDQNTNLLVRATLEVILADKKK